MTAPISAPPEVMDVISSCSLEERALPRSVPRLTSTAGYWILTEQESSWVGHLDRVVWILVETLLMDGLRFVI